MTPAAPPGWPAAEVDHVVIAAATLAQGEAWCEATLGVPPGPGGQHALFGTHNRLLRIDNAAFPATYLEIIAIDPAAAAPPRPRWFGLDDAALQRGLGDAGPRLLHIVARTTAIDAHLTALLGAGIDAGAALSASRQSAEGLLQWRIAVRPDGQLQHGGALPTLIEWRGPHPTRTMAPSPVRLREVLLAGLPPRAAAVLGLSAVGFVAQSPPALRATFDTPRGRVTLESA